MKRSHGLFGFSLLWVCAGCAPSVCDEAFDKAESCGLQNIELNDSGEACGDFAACQAECVINGSCNDIRALSQDPLATNDVADCLFECGE